MQITEGSAGKAPLIKKRRCLTRYKAACRQDEQQVEQKKKKKKEEINK